MSGIKEDVELIKNEEYIKNIIKKNEELTQQELLNLINLKYENSYYVGNKIITADKKYQILVRNDEELTVIVSKYQGGNLEPGEISLDLAYNENVAGVEIYVSMGGIKSYKQYAEDILRDKTEEEKIQLLLDECGCQTLEELLTEMNASSLEEIFQQLGVKDIDELLTKFMLIKGYDQESNEIDVNISGDSGINENINLGEYNYTIDFVTKNGKYNYIATSGKTRSEKEIEITQIDENIDQTNIFEYDINTGYITGIKDEYLISGASLMETYHEANPKFLIYGAPILNIPSEIDGTQIKGISVAAFMDIRNITRVILPNTLQEIEEDAFFFCSNLRCVDISTSVTTIRESAFWQTDIEKLFIPNNVTTIGRRLVYSSKNKIITINCEAPEKPSGWNDEWIYKSYIDKYIVNWGQVKE